MSYFGQVSLGDIYGQLRNIFQFLSRNPARDYRGYIRVVADTSSAPAVYYLNQIANGLDCAGFFARPTCRTSHALNIRSRIT